MGKINDLFEIDILQINRLKNLDYRNDDNYSIKFDYATEFTTFLISKTTIENTVFYIEVFLNNYRIFEIVEEYKISFLGNYLEANYLNINFIDEYKELYNLNWVDKEILAFLKDGKEIYYVNNLYDPTINRKINMVIIPMVTHW